MFPGHVDLLHITSRERTCDACGAKYERTTGKCASSTVSIYGTLIFFLIVLIEPVVPLVFRIHQKPLLYLLPMSFYSFRQERIARRATASTASVCIVTWPRVEATNYRLACRRISQQLVA